MTRKNKHDIRQFTADLLTSNSLRHRPIKGFTFIELIVIVIILSILIGLSIPQLKKTSAHFELENFTKNIYFLCNYLQSSAISEAKIHSLNFFEETRELKPYFLKNDGQWQALKTRFARFYKLPEKITLEITPAEKKSIFFYPDGSADKLVLTFKNEFQDQRALEIKGVTGAIKIQ
jgi:type II secretory pathway pseudopilin PulG